VGKNKMYDHVFGTAQILKSHCQLGNNDTAATELKARRGPAFQFVSDSHRCCFVSIIPI
jgi:hypothetical protein